MSAPSGDATGGAGDAFGELSRAEGIIPALDPAHAIGLARRLAAEDRHDSLLVDPCGRGDGDMRIAAAKFDP